MRIIHDETVGGLVVSRANYLPPLSLAPNRKMWWVLRYILHSSSKVFVGFSSEIELPMGIIDILRHVFFSFQMTVFVSPDFTFLRLTASLSQFR